MSLFQIIAAVVMVAAAFILLIAIRRYMTAASERRTMNMVERRTRPHYGLERLHSSHQERYSSTAPKLHQ